MANRTTINCCRICGATCYRRVIGRDSDGAMRSTGRYCCTGCSVSFSDPKEWRRPPETTQHATPAVRPTGAD
jgi:hypothetical protein